MGPSSLNSIAVYFDDFMPPEVFPPKMWVRVEFFKLMKMES